MRINHGKERIFERAIRLLEGRETKNRVFKTMGFVLLIVPGANVLAKELSLDILIISLPIIVLGSALAYLSENNAIMRCGRYIRRNIEPKVDGIIGWEEWLETRPHWDARSADKFLNYSFYLLFLVYFSGSVFLTTRFLLTEYNAVISVIAAVVYMTIGVCFMLYAYNNIQFSTSTQKDSEGDGDSHAVSPDA